MDNTLSQDNKINTLVRREVTALFREVLSDHDFGLELQPEFIKKLKKSVLSRKKNKVKSLDEILGKYL
ncbi:MAG: hypothetical protein Q8R55_00635 [Candidatus Taylorbacteria bacterium]|nr:hypothetical protein [Candidatus Taylorbacteria bacterium]